MAAAILVIVPLTVLPEGLQPELPGVQVLEQRLGMVPVLALRNPALTELTVSLDFSLENLTPSVRIPVQVVVAPGHTTPPLVALNPSDPARPWHYTYKVYFTWGSPFAQQGTNDVYHLPFLPGSCFRVDQARDGAFSHSGEDRFAVDLQMPEGTSVVAARAGLVVLVRDGFDVGAPDPIYKKRANQIFIRHADGTLGEYLHLLWGGMKVKPGDTVRAGQMLALSGNSGYSRGPHLHFMVFKAKDSKSRESLPIRFVAREGSGLELERGKSYTATAIETQEALDWLK